MLSLALDQSATIVRLMPRESVDASEQKLLGKALAILRDRAELSRAKAGENYGVSEEGWRKYEAGLAPSIFRPDVQDRLLAAIGATREELMEERARLAGEDPPRASVRHITPAERMEWAAARTPTSPAMLPIRDIARAGAWLMADDVGQDQPATYPAVRDPRFPHAHQWLTEVQGDSMNLLNIVDGDLVHCVDAVEIGYYPRTGDVVEVERLRFGGQERELTLKQIEVTAEGLRLWPRSSNPRWRAPLEMTAGLRETEQEVEVRIRALVIAMIRRL